MQRITLERYQVWVYLAAILLGLCTGQLIPQANAVFEAMLWPVLALLLYVTFLQVPLLQVKASLADHRFTAAVVLGNFVVLPLSCWGVLQFLPADPALRLGVLLVLLVPCTDWFITFCQLGGGNTARAIAITPLNLLLQLALLPLYLWFMLDSQLSGIMTASVILPALAVVLLPLLLAGLTEQVLEREPKLVKFHAYSAWLPVPLLALVVFLIAAAQVSLLTNALALLPLLVPLFVGFLVLAALLAKWLSHRLTLPAEQGRTLAFSLGTRNSFVVLPFALSLPAGWEITVMVIVIQSVIELFGMLLYLWWIPRQLFKTE
ncbi:MAG: arsenic resistance protein [Alishewanella aestuarii]